MSRNVFDQRYVKAALARAPVRLGGQPEETIGKAGADVPLVDSDEKKESKDDSVC